MRIAVAGCQWISEYLIEALAAAGRPPAVVVNVGPDAGGPLSGYVDLAPAARRVGAEVYRPQALSLKTDADALAFAAYEIDLLLVFGWPRLIPDTVLKNCRIGAIGVHGGPAPPPRCRGRAVFNWALLLGCDRFHMYAFRLTPGVDDGDIVALRAFTITARDDILTLYHKNCVVSSRLFVEAVEAAAAGRLSGVPQPKTGATYLPKRLPEHGGIDWTASARRIENLARAVTEPYPGAFSDGPQGRVFILDAHVFDEQIPYDAEPGRIVDVFPNRQFVVMTGDFPLYVRACRSTHGFVPTRGYQFATRSGVQPPDPVY